MVTTERVLMYPVNARVRIFYLHCLYHLPPLHLAGEQQLSTALVHSPQRAMQVSRAPLASQCWPQELQSACVVPHQPGLLRQVL
jgi:hypothetical protein